MTDQPTTEQPRTGQPRTDRAEPDPAEVGPLLLSQHVAAPAETVFDFLVEPDKMLRWMGTAVDIDTEAGGTFWMDVNGTDIASGRYQEVVRPERVVFTFGWEDGAFGITPGSSRIQIDLEPKDGGTQLLFVHSGLPEVAVEAHTEGWTHYHGRLAIVAAGGDPGPDPKVKDVV